MMGEGYVVCHHHHHCDIEPFMCRHYDYPECGCVGLSLEEASSRVADWYQEQASQWRNGTHPTVEYYRSSEDQEDNAGESL